MTLMLQIPDGIEAILRRNIPGDLADYARDALAVQLYRDRKLSHGQLQKWLGISSYEVDTLLKKHGGVDEITPDELAEQVDASRRVRQKLRRP